MQPIAKKEYGSQAVTSTTSGTAIGVQDSNNTTINIGTREPYLENILSKGLPQAVHPVIDLSVPIANQVQLFAEDKVRIYAGPDTIKRLWLGNHWELFKEDKEYIVWGEPEKPINPKFEGSGFIKMEISYTLYRDKPRDLRKSNNQ